MTAWGVGVVTVGFASASFATPAFRIHIFCVDH
uniref:Uncharacterized protein n=1 Tax=Anguilla anguilla TaxID=7936 RepID=A0A0E9XGD5_ANGAN